MTFHRLRADDSIAMDPLAVVPNESRPCPPDRPWVFTNMAATLDGATAIDGVSGAIGDDDDHAMFRALRASADVIIVGSRTANVESYRTPQRSDAVDRVRSDAGRAPRPLVAVLSASLSIDPELELFADPSYRPLVFSTDDAPADRRRRLEDAADVVSIGSGKHLDLGRALRHLFSAGHRTVLSEGGPSINGQLIADDLIDEWNLTLSPLLASGDAARPAHGPSPDGLRSFELDRCWYGTAALFCRWVRAGSVVDGPRR